MHRVAGLEYAERGDGPAVLCIHGAIFSDAFAPLMDEPAVDGYRLIRYRRRGYGNSLSLSADPRMDEQVGDALALLEARGVSRVHVVAHSGGGPIAVQLAVDAPDLVQSLTLLEPALQTAEMAAEFDEMVAPLITMHRSGLSAKAVHIFVRGAVGPNWRTRLDHLLPGAAGRAERDAAGTFEGDLAWLRQWDFDEAAPLVDKPTLFMTGSITAPAYEQIEAMVRAAVPSAESAVIEGADHWLNMTHPRPVAEVIAAFLERLVPSETGVKTS